MRANRESIRTIIGDIKLNFRLWLIARFFRSCRLIIFEVGFNDDPALKSLEIQVTQIDKLPSIEKKKQIDIEILRKESVRQNAPIKKKFWFRNIFNRKNDLTAFFVSSLSDFSLEELKAKRDKVKEDIFIKVMQDN